MARSSRRLGEKIPGVSTKINCDCPSTAMPRIKARVVCTLCETMVTFEPTSALSNVDLPALGAPIRAIKPQLVSLTCVDASVIKFIRRHTDTRKHGGCGGLFGGPLGASESFGGRTIR